MGGLGECKHQLIVKQHLGWVDLEEACEELIAPPRPGRPRATTGGLFRQPLSPANVRDSKKRAAKLDADRKAQQAETAHKRTAVERSGPSPGGCLILHRGAVGGDSVLAIYAGAGRHHPA